MTKCKAGSKEAKVNTPIAQLSQKETIAHYNAVMLEDLCSKMQLVLERVDSLAQEFRSELKSFRDEVNVRFASLELAVKKNSERITSLELAVKKNSERITSLELAVKKNSERITSLEKVVSGHSERISTLESSSRGLKEEMMDMELRLGAKMNRLAERFDHLEARHAAFEVQLSRA